MSTLHHLDVSMSSIWKLLVRFLAVMQEAIFNLHLRKLMGYWEQLLTLNLKQGGVRVLTLNPKP